MKLDAIEQLLTLKYTYYNILHKRAFLLPITLFLIIIPLSLIANLDPYGNSLNSSSEMKGCNIFSGKWIPYPQEPYYTNQTCPFIIDHHNCFKNGRPDIDFLKWRWKPDQCELPLFNATEFLEIVKGKSMAFVGDSVGRNQIFSLMCLLSGVAYPEEISPRNAPYNTTKRWLYADYNFSITAFWSPYLVRAVDYDPSSHSYDSIMKLYLDEPDECWANQIQDFDYVMISAGQWFFREMMFYEDDKVVGCYKCHDKRIKKLSYNHGYRKAFEATFKTLMSSEGYKGKTFLRTFSPAHFENGAWNKGGRCERKRPFKKKEKRLDEGYIREMYRNQVKAYRAAKKKGLEVWLLDTTEAMLLRPDGHPNKYGRSMDRNVSVNDCVHWCLPGPIDIWNEFLLYVLKMED